MPLNSTEVAAMETLNFGPVDANLTCSEGVLLSFHGNTHGHTHSHKRNATITIPKLGICVRYRYTGHHNLTENYGGVATFSEDKFQEELHWLLTCPCGRRPDILVVNSGHHDMKLNTSDEDREAIYEKGMLKLGILLSEVKKNGTSVLWKGNFGVFFTYSRQWNSHWQWKDAIARAILAPLQIPYIETDHVITALLQYYDVSCFTTDSTHYGVISWGNSGGNKSILASTMVTQHVISSMVNAYGLDQKNNGGVVAVVR